MKLAAVYNTWTGEDLDMLNASIENIRPVVDMVIVIMSVSSNYGEGEDGMLMTDALDIVDKLHGIKADIRIFDPIKNNVMSAETSKRNYGLKAAMEKGATHYISMDADEFYDQEQFKKERQKFEENDSLAGLVCKTRVYFSRPDLSIGLDTTLAPFIHKITPTLKHEFNRKYPFAWEGLNIRIDPTRSFNITSGVEMSPIVMEHFSWVRRDDEAYKRKIRNSTAKAHLERSNILHDLANAKEGYFCEFYRKPLVRVPNRFNIPYNGVLDEDI